MMMRHDHDCNVQVRQALGEKISSLKLYVLNILYSQITASFRFLFFVWWLG